ncbi:MAG: hypothetical protein HRU19_22935 [Pseudobacteriovorax sp.]|nr:hypothetical protein [Pseudobacteriovorax sp.]
MKHWLVKSANVPGSIWTKSDIEFKNIHEATFEFDYPYCNDIFRSSPFLFVTRIIKDMYKDCGYSGAIFIKIGSKMCEDYIDRFGQAQAPEIYALAASGKPFEDDVFIAWDKKIAFSDRFLDLLRLYNANELEVADIDSPEHWDGAAKFPDDPESAKALEANIRPKWESLMKIKDAIANGKQ